MNSSRTPLMTAGVFQAVAIVLFLQCVFSLFIKFDFVPTINATFTNDYGESIFFSGASPVTGCFQVLITAFWIFITVKAFGKRCYLGGVGAMLEVLLYAYFATKIFVVSGAINGGADYISIMDLNKALALPVFLTDTIAIVAMILLTVKGDISKFIKILFIFYPILSTLAFGLLSGHKWYIWFQVPYAITLVVLSLKSDNKHLKTQLS